MQGRQSNEGRQRLGSWFIACCAVVLLMAAKAVNAQSSWPAESQWRLDKDSKGIKVYSAEIPGSALRAVRGETEVEATMLAAVTALRDPSLRPQWDDLCGDSYLHRSLGESEELVYLHSELPWPVKDRDMFNRVQWTLDAEQQVVSMTSQAEGEEAGLDTVAGRVRVTEARNQWLITPLGNGRLKLVTYAHLDPAGPLPAWLLNTLSVKAPFDILRKLRGLLEDNAIAEQPQPFLQQGSDSEAGA